MIIVLRTSALRKCIHIVVTGKLDLDQTSVAHMESERPKCENSHYSCQFWPYSLVITLDDSEDVCDPKWYLKCPRNFQLPP